MISCGCDNITEHFDRFADDYIPDHVKQGINTLRGAKDLEQIGGQLDEMARTDCFLEYYLDPNTEHTVMGTMNAMVAGKNTSQPGYQPGYYVPPGYAPRSSKEAPNGQDTQSQKPDPLATHHDAGLKGQQTDPMSSIVESVGRAQHRMRGITGGTSTPRGGVPGSSQPVHSSDWRVYTFPGFTGPGPAAVGLQPWTPHNGMPWSAKNNLELSRQALTFLLTHDGHGDGQPPWLETMGFTGGAETPCRSVKKIEKLRVWYRNDTTGSKFFATARIPGANTGESFKRVWKPTGMRHVFCVDEAPPTVVTELGPDTRLEFHKIPTPSVMSSVSTRGQQADHREALLLVQRKTFEITLDSGKKATCNVLWMKSARHPKIPAGDGVEDEMTAPAAADPTGAGEVGVATDPSLTQTKAPLTTAAEVGPVTDAINPPVGLGETSRAVVPLRALAMYEDPDTKDTIVSFFGHENPAGMMNAMGMVGFFMTGGNVSSGVTYQVEHHFQRLGDVLMMRTNESLRTAGPGQAI